MTRFTFVLEFRGGTYLEQVSADTIESAVERYLLVLKEGRETSSFAEALVPELAEDCPVRVTGLQNVWCMSADRNGLALLHIIG